RDGSSVWSRGPGFWPPRWATSGRFDRGPSSASRSLNDDVAEPDGTWLAAGTLRVDGDTGRAHRGDEGPRLGRGPVGGGRAARPVAPTVARAEEGDLTGRRSNAPS